MTTNQTAVNINELHGVGALGDNITNHTFA